MGRRALGRGARPHRALLGSSRGAVGTSQCFRSSRGARRWSSTPISTASSAFSASSRLDRKIVVLASGDPLCFGIGRRLLDAFGKSRLVFLPTVGSIPLAFARLKEPWDDATLVSLHGRPMELLFDAIRRGATKIARADRRDQRSGRDRTEALRGGDGGLFRSPRLRMPGRAGQAHHVVLLPMRSATQRFDPLNVVVLDAAARKSAAGDCRCSDCRQRRFGIGTSAGG